MPTLPVPYRLEDQGKFGPAMKALRTDRMRRFVAALLDFGTNDFTYAARIAGYSDSGGSDASIKVTAHRLAHDEKIQAAMHEEAVRRMNAGKIMAVSHLHNIISNPAHKDQLRAIQILLDRTGLNAATEHKITVERRDEDDKAAMERIKAKMLALGFTDEQRRSMLGQYGVTEAEFTVVEPAAKEEWET